MTTYKAIIFDLGKVVFDLSFDRIFQYWSDASGKPFDDIKSKFKFNYIFDQFEKDEISATRFRNHLSKRLDIKLSDYEFDKGWCDLYLDTYIGINDFLESFKQNYKLVALTNTNIIHSRIWKVKYAGTLKYFERIFCSHEMGERKPDSKAFQIVLDYLQFAPQQTVFLDDNIENIKGAEALGIKSILATSFEQMKGELQKVGIIK
jgi:putative hydrolase of the HAD superfamily